MWYVAGFGLSILLFAYGIFHRLRREKLEVDSAYVSKLVWVALGFGMALIMVVAPAIWLFASLAVRGGTIEDNLPPGIAPQFLLGILVIGACMTLAYTFFGYRDHVFPYRRVLRGWSGHDPLKLGPGDRPEGRRR